MIRCEIGIGIWNLFDFAYYDLLSNYGIGISISEKSRIKGMLLSTRRYFLKSNLVLLCPGKYGIEISTSMHNCAIGNRLIHKAGLKIPSQDIGVSVAHYCLSKHINAMH